MPTIKSSDSARIRRPVTVSLLQFNAKDDAKADNVNNVMDLLAIAGERKSDIAVLPETFTGTGLALDNAAANAEPIPGQTTQRLSEIAAKYRMNIVGSLFESAGNNIYNTAVVLDREGKMLAAYRKSHLYNPGPRPDVPSYREGDKITPGDELCVLDLDFGRVGVAICSDIRFPEIFLNHAMSGAEAVVLPSAFLARPDHWEFLNRARATDNQIYMLSSGMTGKLKDSSINFVGRSMVVDPWGVILAQAPDRETVLTTTIDLEAVKTIQSWGHFNSQRRPALYSELNRTRNDNA